MNYLLKTILLVPCFKGFDCLIMGRKNAKKLIPKSNKNYVLETDVQVRMELPFLS